MNKKNIPFAGLEAEIAKRHSNLLDKLPYGYAICNLIYDSNNQAVDFVFLEVNAAFETIKNIKADEIICKTAQEVFPDYTDCCIKTYSDVISSGHQSHFIHYEAATDKYFDVTAYKIGENLFVTIYADLTTQKKMLNSVYDAEKEKALGKLASGVAHNISNILSVIIGYGELTLRDTNLAPHISENVKRILQSANQSTKLAHELLDYGGSQDSQSNNFDLNKSLRTIHKTMSAVFGDDISLDLELSKDDSGVFADKSKIEKAIVSILQYVRSTLPEEKGRVSLNTLSVALDCDFEKKHPNINSGEHVLLKITGDRTELSQAELQHIFEPFYLSNSSLSLPVAYGIIANNKGTITVETEPNRGISFNIYLPWQKFTSTTQTDKAITKDTLSGSGLILLVEDEEFVRMSLTHVLKSFGYDIISAENGLEAVEICESRGAEIALTITDVIMPKMGGFDLADVLKEKYPSMKLLFMSGYNKSIATENNRYLLGNNYIEKPIGYEEMGKIVREILDA